MRSKAFQSRNICFIKGEGELPFVREEERIVLVNMVQHCERMAGETATTYPTFNGRQMKAAIADTDELIKMTGFIDALRKDMRHNFNVVPTNLEMSRRYGGTPFRRTTGPNANGTKPRSGFYSSTTITRAVKFGFRRERSP